MLKGKGKTEVIDKIQSSIKGVSKGKKKIIYAVDDSTMMLKLYKKKLHTLGYEPIVFQYPAEAIKAVSKKKPNLIITDLNMPMINGLQLAKEVRLNHNEKEVPIIMITTQSDFLGRTQDKTTPRINKEAILKAGVNVVLHKPFKDTELAKAISTHVDN